MVSTNVTVIIIDCLGKMEPVRIHMNQQESRLEETLQVSIQGHSSDVSFSFLIPYFLFKTTIKRKTMLVVFDCWQYYAIFYINITILSQILPNTCFISI